MKIQRTFSIAALGALLMGGAIVGCGGEDYTELDNEYASMNDALASKYAEVEKGFNEMNAELGTISVADDWDDARRASYDAARAQMDDYNKQLQDGKQKMAQWKVDLEAAKQESREVYEARLKEARSWYDEYNAWLDNLNNDIVRYREAKASEGTDPWWVTVYTVNAQGTTTADGTATTGDDDDGKMDEEADGFEDDKEAIKGAAKDVKDAAKDAATSVKDAFRDVTNDSDKD